MAIYHASTKPIARSAGRSAVAAAAYRAGIELVDARTGLVHDYTRKGGVLYTDILTRDGFGAERNALWNAAESAERRKDARTAREWIVALPEELNVYAQKVLVHDFSKALAERYGVAVDMAIHAPDREGDNRNFHAHILTTTRQVSHSSDGGLVFGDKAHIELSDKKRRERGMGAAADEVKAVRELWEHTANAALERAGVDARIDARSLAGQGIDREATRHLGQVATEMERRGLASGRGDINQEILIANIQRARLSVEISDLQGERHRREAVAKAEQERQHEAAEREVAEIARREGLLKRAQARQQGRDILDRIKTRERWRKRRETRQNRQRDLEAAAEQRPGLRHPDRPQWQVYRERILTEAYNLDVAQALGRWVKVERVEHGLHIHNRQMDLTDYGDRITAGLGGQEKEIDAMLQLARAKGWQSLTLTGNQDFQERAGAAAMAAGFDLADTDLVVRVTAAQDKESEAQRIRDLEGAPVLAEWMRAHPKQAQAQRLAGGKLPLACPEGLDRAALQRSALWDAADAWMVGRYGEKATWQALSKDPDPLKAQAAAAGREAAYNAWAQGGLTLKIGKDAPAGPGIAWTLSGVETRESVERYAGFLQDRRKRAGVDHGVTVTFGGDVSLTKKVLVLEHLLRKDVPLDEPALEKVGDRYALDQARERLKTHEPDGQPQAWYVRDQEQQVAQRQRDDAARIRADRVKRLDALALHLQQNGSENSGKHFREAGFVVNEKGGYAYPDPDLPGVRAAWDALAAARRKETEEDIGKLADGVGYRAKSGQWSKERRNEDTEYQRLMQELQADPSLRERANTAYQQGMDRARQAREAQRERDRKALLDAAHKLGRRAEKGGSNAAKQAETQRGFVELVQRGVGLGVDEKALSKSLQGGREAYRQEKGLSRSHGMRL